MKGVLLGGSMLGVMVFYIAPLGFIPFARRSPDLHCTRCWLRLTGPWAAVPMRCPRCDADLSERDAAMRLRLPLARARWWIAAAAGLATAGGVLWLVTWIP